LTQLLLDRNNEENSDNDEREEKNKTQKTRNAKESYSSSIDAEVIKGIPAQISSLAQRDELKKVGMTRPYPLEWDSDPYLPKFKPIYIAYVQWQELTKSAHLLLYVSKWDR